MSLNYMENTGTATSWRRANAVTITNPLNQIEKAAITFTEEDVVQKGVITLATPAGAVTAQFSVTGEFDILNPDTGAVTGSMTHAELYAVLYSLYMKVAADRDAAIGG